VSSSAQLSPACNHVRYYRILVKYDLPQIDSLIRIQSPGCRIKTCAISLIELHFGAYKSSQVKANLAIVRKLESSFEVLSIGKESAGTFGMLKASLQKSGTPLDDFDLAILTCALGSNLTLVTNNTKHFSRISGLRITNWAIPPEKAVDEGNRYIRIFLTDVRQALCNFVHLFAGIGLVFRAAMTRK